MESRFSNPTAMNEKNIAKMQYASNQAFHIYNLQYPLFPYSISPTSFLLSLPIFHIHAKRPAYWLAFSADWGTAFIQAVPSKFSPV